MKKLKFILFVFTISFMSCNKAKENQIDLNQIKIGMKMDSVDSIMRNNPLSFKSKYDGDSIITKIYEAPVGASGDFEITFMKKDSTVSGVYYGD